MNTHKDNLIAIGPEGQEISIEAQVGTIKGEGGNMVKHIESLTINIPTVVNVDKDQSFLHPVDGTRYKINI